MTKKVYVKTFGCQMNEYDSDKMVDVLGAAEGLVKTDTPEDADVILFNTCSVREKAQEKVFSDLGRVRELKEANPNLIIGVGGCVASQEGASIVARAPYVDLVFGPQTLHRLPQMIDQRRASGREAVAPVVDHAPDVAQQHVVSVGDLGKAGQRLGSGHGRGAKRRAGGGQAGNRSFPRKREARLFWKRRRA